MAASAPSLWDNPLGHRRLRVRRIRGPRSCRARPPVRADGLHRGRAAPLQERAAVRQGDINFIVNAEPDSFAQSFARVHGPSICAMAFRVRDAAAACRRRVAQGAWGVQNHPGPMELNIPAIKGIGDSLIYLVDRYPGHRRTAAATCRSTTSTSSRSGRRPASAGRRPHLSRPPDAQRVPRPHGQMGRLLRAHLQFPRDPLLRHRGQADGLSRRR